MNNKPNFASMATEQLIKYVLEHREDNDAFYELSDRVRANGQPLNIDELPEIIRRKRQGQ
ncbi:hypothetical protein NIES4071_63390 [Calothrix sp. NIES-4071]|nr:hypothetical protein NIES4071_63390 [Calothrix sp. NIES-4071]BAZ60642.1 hypothetical protein NIES4105_63340 [Calothrix sp. NIES-4105]